MNGPFEQFSHEELHAAAMKLEKVARNINGALLKVGFIDPDRLIPAVVGVYSEILRFDKFTKAKFERSIEEKKVRTLSQDGVIMTCVLSAAVALTELKNTPKPTQQNLFQKGLTKLRETSTSPMTLAGLSLAGFYGLMGRGIFLRAKTATKSKVISSGLMDRLQNFKKKIK